MHKQSQKSTFLYYPHIINRIYYKTLYKSNVTSGHHAGHGISCGRDEITRVQRHAHCLFFGQKIIFHFPKCWNQATMLNKWSSWSCFWVRKFVMINGTLHNTWFGTKISRAFSIVCIWSFYLRFVVSDPLVAPIFPWWRYNKPCSFRFQWHRFSRRQVFYICRNAHFCAKIRALQSDGNIFETKDYIFFSCMKLSVNAQT